MADEQVFNAAKFPSLFPSLKECSVILVLVAAATLFPLTSSPLLLQ
tara:strand:- start:460 stop:597 length:138 start_codon:yes stop_codon:yes gene_type:complete